MDAVYKEIAELMVALKPCVALTGAGISAESGIPTFRSRGGLWEKFDPMIYASIEAFREDPAKYWTIRCGLRGRRKSWQGPFKDFIRDKKNCRLI